MTLQTQTISPSAFIPVCSWCKKIRDGRGIWKDAKASGVNPSSRQFTHGICPVCSKNLYSELLKGF